MAPYIESTGNPVWPLDVGLLPGETKLDLPVEISNPIVVASAEIATRRVGRAQDTLHELAIGKLRSKIGLPEKYSELLKNAVTKGNKLKICFTANIVHPPRVGHDYETKNHRVLQMEIGQQ